MANKTWASSQKPVCQRSPCWKPACWKSATVINIPKHDSHTHMYKYKVVERTMFVRTKYLHEQGNFHNFFHQHLFQDHVSWCHVSKNTRLSAVTIPQRVLGVAKSLVLKFGVVFTYFRKYTWRSTWNMHALSHTHTHTCTHVRTRAHAHTQTRTHTHTHTHKHTHRVPLALDWILYVIS